MRGTVVQYLSKNMTENVEKKTKQSCVIKFLVLDFYMVLRTLPNNNCPIVIILSSVSEL